MSDVKFICTRCGNIYFVPRRFVAKRKTTMCKSCVLTVRNKTEKMREAVRKVGLRSPSQETRDKLRYKQLEFWTDERKEARSGDGNPVWNGGKTKKTGYILIRCPGHPRATKKGDYVFEHILVMEQHVGRYLNSDEVVHHINGIRDDNRIENLQLLTSSEHMKIHNNWRWNHEHRNALA